MPRVPLIVSEPSPAKVSWLTKTLSQRAFLYFLMAELTIFALWLESVGLPGALQKYGAALLLFALIVLWRWLVVGEARQRLGRLSDALDRVRFWSDDKGQHFAEWTDGNGRTRLQGDQARRYLQHDKNAREGTWELLRIESRLARLQIEVAIYGTFLNGFGDQIILSSLW